MRAVQTERMPRRCCGELWRVACLKVSGQHDDISPFVDRPGCGAVDSRSDGQKDEAKMMITRSIEKVSDRRLVVEVAAGCCGGLASFNENKGEKRGELRCTWFHEGNDR
jgi:hypothetical protein